VRRLTDLALLTLALAPAYRSREHLSWWWADAEPVLPPGASAPPLACIISTMTAGTALGQYLRARRALVRPEDVGLPHAGRRRVPGLRREELASLAGISPDYYLRLEQGRDHRPSVQVIEARLGVALLLSCAEDHAHA
jgi:hypothetical protein